MASLLKSKYTTTVLSVTPLALTHLEQYDPFIVSTPGPSNLKCNMRILLEHIQATNFFEGGFYILSYPNFLFLLQDMVLLFWYLALKDYLKI